MQKIVLRITLALIVFILIGIIGTLFFEEVCFPMSSHGSISLGCNLAIYTPIYSAVATGIITGWRINYFSVLWVLIASSIGLAVLFRGFFTHWYGSDLQNTINFIMLWNLLPAIITTFFISSYYVYKNR